MSQTNESYSAPEHSWWAHSLHAIHWIQRSPHLESLNISAQYKHAVSSELSGVIRDFLLIALDFVDSLFFCPFVVVATAVVVAAMGVTCCVRITFAFSCSIFLCGVPVSTAVCPLAFDCLRRSVWYVFGVGDMWCTTRCWWLSGRNLMIILCFYCIRRWWFRCQH